MGSHHPLRGQQEEDQKLTRGRKWSPLRGLLRKRLEEY